MKIGKTMNMSGYTKLFSSIVTSTIWNEPSTVRIVWITMLAVKDQFGIVEASLPGLAVIARVSLQECTEAVERLEAPDPDSRTKENEGRRIQKVDGGWLILNHEKYRDKGCEDERRDYMRKYMKDRRKAVSKRKQTLAQLAHTDTETEANTDTKAETPGEGSHSKTRGEGGGPVHLLISGWCQRFKTTFGQAYQVSGKDAGSARRLLQSGMAPEALLTIAAEAWRLNGRHSWEQSQAIQISSFAASLPKIQLALGKLKPVSQQRVADIEDLCREGAT